MSEYIQTISCSGTAYEVGYRVGRLGKKKVLRTLMYYQHLVAMKKPYWSWAQIRSFAGSYEAVIADFDWDILEELRGIADGSQIPFEDVLAMNCHYEIGRWTDECTTFYLGSQVTENKHTYLLENWDYGLMQLDSLLLLDLKVKGKPRVVMLTEAGIIGRMGMNTAGIGMVGNTLKNDKVACDKLPVPIFYRAVLNASTAEEIAAVIAKGCASSYNFLFFDGKQACDIEVDPTKVLKEAGSDKICHTNHFIQSLIIEDRKYDTLESSKRYNRACELINARDCFGETDMIAMLRDHYHYPDSICRHIDESQPYYAQSATLASVMMDMSSLTMYYMSGYPCAGNYEQSMMIQM